MDAATAFGASEGARAVWGGDGGGDGGLSRAGRAGAESGDGLDDAALDADGSAVGARGKGAGDEGDRVGDFLRREESLDEGGAAGGLEELSLEVCRGLAGLLGEVGDEGGDTFGGGGPRENGVDGD